MGRQASGTAQWQIVLEKLGIWSLSRKPLDFQTSEPQPLCRDAAQTPLELAVCHHWLRLALNSGGSISQKRHDCRWKAPPKRQCSVTFNLSPGPAAYQAMATGLELVFTTTPCSRLTPVATKAAPDLHVVNIGSPRSFVLKEWKRDEGMKEGMKWGKERRRSETGKWGGGNIGVRTRALPYGCSQGHGAC